MAHIYNEQWGKTEAPGPSRTQFSHSLHFNTLGRDSLDQHFLRSTLQQQWMRTRINFNTLRSEECNLQTQYRIIAPFYKMLTMLLLKTKVSYLAISLRPLPECSYSGQGLRWRSKNGQLFQKNCTSTAPSAQVSVCSVWSRFIIAILGRLGQRLRFVHSQSQETEPRAEFRSCNCNSLHPESEKCPLAKLPTAARWCNTPARGRESMTVL